MYVHVCDLLLNKAEDLCELSFLQLLKNSPRRQLCFKGEDVMWLQPSSLDELLNLKARYPEAKLVVGNTEVGESWTRCPIFVQIFSMTTVGSSYIKK